MANSKSKHKRQQMKRSIKFKQRTQRKKAAIAKLRASKARASAGAK